MSSRYSQSLKRRNETPSQNQSLARGNSDAQRKKTPIGKKSHQKLLQKLQQSKQQQNIIFLHDTITKIRRNIYQRHLCEFMENLKSNASLKYQKILGTELLIKTMTYHQTENKKQFFSNLKYYTQKDFIDEYLSKKKKVSRYKKNPLQKFSHNMSPKKVQMQPGFVKLQDIFKKLRKKRLFQGYKRLLQTLRFDQSRSFISDNQLSVSMLSQSQTPVYRGNNSQKMGILKQIVDQPQPPAQYFKKEKSPINASNSKPKNKRQLAQSTQLPQQQDFMQSQSTPPKSRYPHTTQNSTTQKPPLSNKKLNKYANTSSYQSSHPNTSQFGQQEKKNVNIQIPSSAKLLETQSSEGPEFTPQNYQSQKKNRNDDIYNNQTSKKYSKSSKKYDRKPIDTSDEYLYSSPTRTGKIKSFIDVKDRVNKMLGGLSKLEDSGKSNRSSARSRERINFKSSKALKTQYERGLIRIFRLIPKLANRRLRDGFENIGDCDCDDEKALKSGRKQKLAGPWMGTKNMSPKRQRQISPQQQQQQQRFQATLPKRTATSSKSGRVRVAAPQTQKEIEEEERQKRRQQTLRNNNNRNSNKVSSTNAKRSVQIINEVYKNRQKRNQRFFLLKLRRLKNIEAYSRQFAQVMHNLFARKYRQNQILGMSYLKYYMRFKKIQQFCKILERRVKKPTKNCLKTAFGQLKLFSQQNDIKRYHVMAIDRMFEIFNHKLQLNQYGQMYLFYTKLQQINETENKRLLGLKDVFRMLRQKNKAAKLNAFKEILLHTQKDGYSFIKNFTREQKMLHQMYPYHYFDIHNNMVTKEEYDQLPESERQRFASFNTANPKKHEKIQKDLRNQNVRFLSPQKSYSNNDIQLDFSYSVYSQEKRKNRFLSKSLSNLEEKQQYQSSDSIRTSGSSGAEDSEFQKRAKQRSKRMMVPGGKRKKNKRSKNSSGSNKKVNTAPPINNDDQLQIRLASQQSDKIDSNQYMSPNFASTQSNNPYNQFIDSNGQQQFQFNSDEPQSQQQQNMRNPGNQYPSVRNIHGSQQNSSLDPLSSIERNPNNNNNYYLGSPDTNFDSNQLHHHTPNLDQFLSQQQENTNDPSKQRIINNILQQQQNIREPILQQTDFTYTDENTEDLGSRQPLSSHRNNNKQQSQIPSSQQHSNNILPQSQFSYLSPTNTNKPYRGGHQRTPSSQQYINNTQSKTEDLLDSQSIGSQVQQYSRRKENPKQEMDDDYYQYNTNQMIPNEYLSDYQQTPILDSSVQPGKKLQQSQIHSYQESQNQSQVPSESYQSQAFEKQNKQKPPHYPQRNDQQQQYDNQNYFGGNPQQQQQQQQQYETPRYNEVNNNQKGFNTRYQNTNKYQQHPQDFQDNQDYNQFNKNAPLSNQIQIQDEQISGDYTNIFSTNSPSNLARILQNKSNISNLQLDNSGSQINQPNNNRFNFRQQPFQDQTNSSKDCINTSGSQHPRNDQQQQQQQYYQSKNNNNKYPGGENSSNQIPKLQDINDVDKHMNQNQKQNQQYSQRIMRQGSNQDNDTLDFQRQSGRHTTYTNNPQQNPQFDGISDITKNYIQGELPGSQSQRSTIRNIFGPNQGSGSGQGGGQNPQYSEERQHPVNKSDLPIQSQQYNSNSSDRRKYSDNQLSRTGKYSPKSQQNYEKSLSKDNKANYQTPYLPSSPIGECIIPRNIKKFQGAGGGQDQIKEQQGSRNEQLDQSDITQKSAPVQYKPNAHTYSLGQQQPMNEDLSKSDMDHFRLKQQEQLQQQYRQQLQQQQPPTRSDTNSPSNHGVNSLKQSTNPVPQLQKQSRDYNNIVDSIPLSSRKQSSRQNSQRAKLRHPKIQRQQMAVNKVSQPTEEDDYIKLKDYNEQQPSGQINSTQPQNNQTFRYSQNSSQQYYQQQMQDPHLNPQQYVQNIRETSNLSPITANYTPDVRFSGQMTPFTQRNTRENSASKHAQTGPATNSEIFYKQDQVRQSHDPETFKKRQQRMILPSSKESLEQSQNRGVPQPLGPSNIPKYSQKEYLSQKVSPKNQDQIPSDRFKKDAMETIKIEDHKNNNNLLQSEQLSIPRSPSQKPNTRESQIKLLKQILNKTTDYSGGETTDRSNQKGNYNKQKQDLKRQLQKEKDNKLLDQLRDIINKRETSSSPLNTQQNEQGVEYMPKKLIESEISPIPQRQQEAFGLNDSLTKPQKPFVSQLKSPVFNQSEKPMSDIQSPNTLSILSPQQKFQSQRSPTSSHSIRHNPELQQIKERYQNRLPQTQPSSHRFQELQNQIERNKVPVSSSDYFSKQQQQAELGYKKDLEYLDYIEQQSLKNSGNYGHKPAFLSINNSQLRSPGGYLDKDNIKRKFMQSIDNFLENTDSILQHQSQTLRTPSQISLSNNIQKLQQQQQEQLRKQEMLKEKINSQNQSFQQSRNRNNDLLDQYKTQSYKSPTGSNMNSQRYQYSTVNSDGYQPYYMNSGARKSPSYKTSGGHSKLSQHNSPNRSMRSVRSDFHLQKDGSLLKKTFFASPNKTVVKDEETLNRNKDQIMSSLKKLVIFQRDIAFSLKCLLINENFTLALMFKRIFGYEDARVNDQEFADQLQSIGVDITPTQLALIRDKFTYGKKHHFDLNNFCELYAPHSYYFGFKSARNTLGIYNDDQCFSSDWIHISRNFSKVTNAVLNFMVQLEYIKTDLEEFPKFLKLKEILDYLTLNNEEFILESEVREFIEKNQLNQYIKNN